MSHSAPQPAVPEFAYRNGALEAEGLPLALIAERVGTPFYLYSASAMQDAYRRFTAALEGLNAQVFYAMKANGNQAVIRCFSDLGAGADVVSEGELRRALAAGIPAEKIVFAGVGKTEREMTFALEAEILQFNAESWPELERLDAVARSLGKVAPVAIRLWMSFQQKEKCSVSPSASSSTSAAASG